MNKLRLGPMISTSVKSLVEQVWTVFTTKQEE